MRVTSLHKLRGKVKNIYPSTTPTQLNTKPKKEGIKEGMNDGRRRERKEGKYICLESQSLDERKEEAGSKNC